MSSSRIIVLLLIVVVSIPGCGGDPLQKPLELSALPGHPTTVARWEDAPKPPVEPKLNAIDLEDDAEHGWAVGDNGLIERYVFDEATQRWRTTPYTGLELNRHLKDIWISEDGKQGWAVGHGTILRFENGEWRIDEAGSALAEGALFGLWMNKQGSSGWAVGYHGLIVRYDNRSGWQPFRKPEGNSQDSLLFVWLNAEETKGWAVGNSETVQYDGRDSNVGARWVQLDQHANPNIDVPLPIPPNYDLMPLEILNDGDAMWWAHHGKRVIFFSKGTVERSQDMLDPIWGLSFTTDGNRGAVFCVNDTNLIYHDGGWHELARKTLPGRSEFLHFAGKGDTGWGVFEVQQDKPLYKYADGNWTRVESVPAPISDLALDKKLLNGWYVHDSTSLGRVKDGDWAATSPLDVDSLVPPIGDDEFADANWMNLSPTEFLPRISAIWQSPHSAQAWLLASLYMPVRDRRLKICSGSVLLRYAPGTGRWEVDSELSTDTSRNTQLWMDSTGMTGWARVESTIYRYEDRTWSEAYHSRHALRTIWIGPSGTTGWAVGEFGTILQLKSGRWRTSEYDGLYSVHLHGLCMADDGKTGWAYGANSTLLEYESGLWTRARRDEFEYEGSLDRLWCNSDNSFGRIYDGRDMVLTLSREGVGPVSLSFDPGFNRKTVEGRCTLHIAKGLAIAGAPSVQMLAGGQLLDLATTVVGRESNNVEVELDGAKLAERFAHQDAALRIEFELSNSQFPKTYVYQSGNVLTLAGPSPWLLVAEAGACLSALNLLLVLLAIRWRWARRVILDPVGAHVVGLVVGKYLLIDFLVRFVHPIKLAMFRDYRHKLLTEPAVTAWEDKVYIPPEVDMPGDTKPMAQDDREQWERALDALLVQPLNRLWLILGESGLGKTALLEQWTARALTQGKTPLLIRLGADRTAFDEAAQQMEQIGDLTLTSDSAKQILAGGGFVVFLDGLNEDTDLASARDLARQLCKRNLLVATSQFDPGWGRLMTVERLRLREFGRTQLLTIFEDDELVDQVLASEHLKHAARLPQTAQLVAAYARRNNSLPKLTLDIYEDQRKQLADQTAGQGVEGQVINLEKRAWELFCRNYVFFKADDATPAPLCEAAVTVGMLSSTSQGYRFRHELIGRFMVARFLARQDSRPLEEWHEQLDAGLGRAYWGDAIEFWAEMIAGTVIAGETKPDRYETFLREAAGFSRDLFRQRLYPQADRLDQAGLISLTDGMVRWAARELTFDD